MKPFFEKITRACARVKDHFASRAIAPETVFASLAAGFCAAGTATLFSAGTEFTKLDFLTGVHVPTFFVILCLTAAALLLCTYLVRRRTVLSLGLVLAAVAYAGVLAVTVSDIWFNLGLCLVLVLIMRYALREENGLFPVLSRLCIPPLAGWISVAVMVLVFTVVVGYATSCKHFTFSESAFDFGIFAQMFEQMAKTGLPVTTLERGGELTHFAVHFSPIYYLLLPFYMLFRTPVFLYWAQALIVGAGAFAVFGIAGKLKLSPFAATTLSAIYLMFPSMANGCFYDFHENKFLPVCLLFLLYFLLEKDDAKPRSFGGEWLQFLPALGCALLTLSVKEDAAIYVGTVAVWLLLSQKRKWRGVALLILSVAYFFFALAMIRHFGGEEMISRLSDYIPKGESGFGAVLRTCVYDLAFVIKQVFTADKLGFVLWMLLPVLFAPFLTKRLSTALLLLPMLVINLMPSWTYQYNVDYQYTYGVGALVVFSLCLFSAEAKPETGRRVLAMSLVLTAVLGASVCFPKIGRYVDRYKNPEGYDASAAVIEETVPAGASVTCAGFLAPHLYYIDELYSVPVYYGALSDTDYYVIDTRYDSSSKYNTDDYRGDRYELVAEGGFVKIYRLKSLGGN